MDIIFHVLNLHTSLTSTTYYTTGQHWWLAELSRQLWPLQVRHTYTYDRDLKSGLYYRLIGSPRSIDSYLDFISPALPAHRFISASSYNYSSLRSSMVYGTQLPLSLHSITYTFLLSSHFLILVVYIDQCFSSHSSSPLPHLIIADGTKFTYSAPRSQDHVETI